MKKLIISVWAFIALPLFAQRDANIRIYPEQGNQQISKHIYGQFAEHLGSCIYGGLWKHRLDEIQRARSSSSSPCPGAISSRRTPWGLSLCGRAAATWRTCRWRSRQAATASQTSLVSAAQAAGLAGWRPCAPIECHLSLRGVFGVVGQTTGTVHSSKNSFTLRPLRVAMSVVYALLE